jgi:hypothetical protein
MKRGPLRLRDDPTVPEELRELMAEPHAGPPKLDAATKAASIASVVAGAGAASASVAAGTTATGVKLWLVIGGLCVGGVVAGVTLGTGGDRAEPPAEAAAAPTVSGVGPAIEAPVPEEEAPAAEPEPEPTPAEAPAAVSPARPTGRGRGPAPTGVDALRAEATLLESARALLESRPRAALRATREHVLAHPMGQLESEREMIAIEALQRLGRARAAERRARALLRAHPTGIYADRVRRLLESPTE